MTSSTGAESRQSAANSWCIAIASAMLLGRTTFASVCLHSASRIRSEQKRKNTKQLHCLINSPLFSQNTLSGIHESDGITAEKTHQASRVHGSSLHKAAVASSYASPLFRLTEYQNTSQGEETQGSNRPSRRNPSSSCYGGWRFSPESHSSGLRIA